MKNTKPTKLIEDHFIQQAREFCKLRGTLVDSPELVRYQTGDRHPFFNGIMYCKFEEAALLSEIKRAKADAIKKDLPFAWIVGPSSKPDNICQILEAEGFISPFYLTGMYAPINLINFERSAKPDLKIKRVDSIAMLELWKDVLVIGMEDDPPLVSDFLADLFLKLGLDQNCHWQNYVGFCEGQPVCTSTLLNYQGTASIYCVATLPEFRQRGFGSAITLAPLEQAASLGLKHAVLHASEMAVGMYQKLGFDERCRLPVYLFNAG